MTIIDEIKEKIRLEDVVSETATVRLRRSGANYTGFCPFHTNKDTPALVIWGGTQTWKCFGSCNEGGDVLDWVMKKNPGWDIKEAIKELAKIGNIPMGDMDGPELKQRLAIHARESALQIAARLFAKWLQEDPEALEYRTPEGRNI